MLQCRTASPLKVFCLALSFQARMEKEQTRSLIKNFQKKQTKQNKTKNKKTLSELFRARKTCENIVKDELWDSASRISTIYRKLFRN